VIFRQIQLEEFGPYEQEMRLRQTTGIVSSSSASEPGVGGRALVTVTEVNIPAERGCGMFPNWAIIASALQESLEHAISASMSTRKDVGN